MTAHHTTRLPQKNLAAFKAGELIHKEGPKTIAELFSAIDFGKSSNRQPKIDGAIARGWLIEADGKIALSEFARLHFRDDIEVATVPYIGIAATPREPLTPLYERPALSRKNMTNSRGDHVREIDASFQRAAGFRSHSVPTGRLP